MAKVKAYAFHDKKLGAFMIPFFQANEAVAKRAAHYALNNEKSELYAIREDLELWQLGEFDDETGMIAGGEITLVAAMGALIDG